MLAAAAAARSMRIISGARLSLICSSCFLLPRACLLGGPVPLALATLENSRDVSHLATPHIPGLQPEPPPLLLLGFVFVLQPRLGFGGFSGEQGFVMVLRLFDDVTEEASVGV